jgi:hypothetical protein
MKKIPGPLTLVSTSSWISRAMARSGPYPSMSAFRADEYRRESPVGGMTLIHRRKAH